MGSRGTRGILTVAEHVNVVVEEASPRAHLPQSCLQLKAPINALRQNDSEHSPLDGRTCTLGNQRSRGSSAWHLHDVASGLFTCITDFTKRSTITKIRHGDSFVAEDARLGRDTSQFSGCTRGRDTEGFFWGGCHPLQAKVTDAHPGWRSRGAVVERISDKHHLVARGHIAKVPAARTNHQ